MCASPQNWFIDIGLMPSPTVVLDEKATIVFTNPAWDAFATDNNYQGVDFIGINYAALCLGVDGVEKSQAHSVAQGLRGLLNQECNSFQLTYPCHAPTQKRWYRCVAFRHGQHIVMSHIDISEEYQSQQGASGLASDVLKSSQLFHDLRSPLTTIIGYAQACQTYPDEKLKQVREGHALIEQAGERLLDIVNDIMDVVQDSCDPSPADESPVHLLSLVDEIFRALDVQAKKCGVQLSYDIHDNLILMADEKKLWRLLTNLCVNAIKYNVDQGRVSVSAVLNNSAGVVVRVQDTGLGIPEDRQATIFDPFGQVAQEENWQGREGVGLGLTIVQELCAHHEAEIDLASEVGAGSTFRVTFPSWRTVRNAKKKDAKHALSSKVRVA